MKTAHLRYHDTQHDNTLRIHSENTVRKITTFLRRNALSSNCEVTDRGPQLLKDPEIISQKAEPRTLTSRDKATGKAQQMPKFAEVG